MTNTYNLRHRLLNEKSFIFNDGDGSSSRNLILIPENFKNKDCRVDNKSAFMSNKTEAECQLFLEKRSIRAIYEFLKKVRLDHSFYLLEDSQYKLPLNARFLLGDSNNVTLSLHIIK